MDKRQKTLLYAAIIVVASLVALSVVLIVSNSRQSQAAEQAEARADSLSLANDRLQLKNEFDQLNADFSQYEDQQIYLKNDSLVQQYNQARMKVEGLLKELESEKKSHAGSRARIKELEGEIATLKGILKHYLEEIRRLGEENEGLRKEIQEVSERNERLESQVTTTARDNQQLTQTVQLARKLNITGLSLSPLNKKGKAEKNVTKAKQLYVHFTVSPNNTAAPGMKNFYVRISTPEGTLLTGGGNFQLDGATLAATAHRQVEYANEELSVSLYWDVTTTLTPGDYLVEVFCDGYRLASRRINLKK
ncbi:MAG: hypothetical protein HDS26_06945 [Bacteroides sp.]|nr:hypothetical protein [Bacteroides sp.]